MGKFVALSIMKIEPEIFTDWEKIPKFVNKKVNKVIAIFKIFLHSSKDRN